MRISVSNRVLVEYFPEGALLYEMEHFRFIETNHTGAQVLKWLIEEIPLKDIEKKLSEWYDISCDEAQKDVHRFCGFFQQKGLICFSPSAESYHE